MKKTILFLCLLGFQSALWAQNPVFEGNNRFALDLYKKVAKDDQNLFFSPYSIYSALGMTYAGARTTTAQEMKTTLYFQQANDEFFNHFAGLFAFSESLTNPELSFEVGNALWLQSGSTLESDFKQIMEKYFEASLQETAFSASPEKSRKKINKWVEKQTHKKIKDLVPKGVIKKNTRFVLTNAIYFKGTWLDEFDQKNTYQSSFFAGGTQELQTDFMNREDKYSYFSGEVFHAVEIPYHGERVVMQILLPHKGKTISDLEEAFTYESYAAWQTKQRTVKVDLHLPKFEMATSFELSDALKALGMPDAFSNNADFSGINGSQNLRIDNVIHKAFVEVNEKGTEAAAATAVVLGLKSMPVREEIVFFKADRPFIFLLKDRQTQTILFAGKLNNPKQ